MVKRILVIQGHPDAAGGHFGDALMQAYVRGGRDAGHEVRVLGVASLDFPLLRSKAEWENGELPSTLAVAQANIAWAEHLVIFFPLWLGGMPALLKGFFEQIARPGFALSREPEGRLPKKLLTGRSARLVVTMGMPALIYRLYFRAHSLKALERNILGFVGIGPIHETLIGSVEAISAREHGRALLQLGRLGRAGA